jgi:sialate O-acetylesterase
MIRNLLLASTCLFLTAPCQAELKMSSVFGDHMVLQQKQPIRIWGWTSPNQSVSVAIASQKAVTKADSDGRFQLNLEPVAAGGPYTLTVAADETRTFQDVLIGEVWLCSGQSNMQFAVSSSNDSELEALAANYPEIRLSRRTISTVNGQSAILNPFAAFRPLDISSGVNCIRR